MFYVKLEPKSKNKDIYEVGSLLDCRIESLGIYHIPNVRFLNALTARSMDTLKVFALIGPDASNPQKIIQNPLIAHAKRNPRTSNAFCTRATIKSNISQIQRLYTLQGFAKEFLPNISKKVVTSESQTRMKPQIQKSDTPTRKIICFNRKN